MLFVLKPMLCFQVEYLMFGEEALCDVMMWPRAGNTWHNSVGVYCSCWAWYSAMIEYIWYWVGRGCRTMSNIEWKWYVWVMVDVGVDDNFWVGLCWFCWEWVGIVDGACSKYMCGGQTGMKCLPCSLPQLSLSINESWSSHIIHTCFSLSSQVKSVSYLMVLNKDVYCKEIL